MVHRELVGLLELEVHAKLHDLLVFDEELLDGLFELDSPIVSLNFQIGHLGFKLVGNCLHFGSLVHVLLS